LAGALAIVSRLAPQERWQRIVETITDADRLVVRSWAFPQKDEEVPEAMRNHMAVMMMGVHIPNWDVENEIVIAEPFMSYVVHDAVALAGLAHRLPKLCRRWGEFLIDGYDTIGENWGHGTHVHGWSCTPVKDLTLYTLGVSPAEPGYAVARIAPRLGDLAWAKGNVPTPHGLIRVEVNEDGLAIESPIPVVVDLPNRPLLHLGAERHRVG
jgi:hypothetical protein